MHIVDNWSVNKVLDIIRTSTVLVNIFINAIYLYDGYFTMILNAGNRPLSVENIPLEDIEKTFENDDAGCSTNSQLGADAPPSRKPLRSSFLSGFSYFCG